MSLRAGRTLAVLFFVAQAVALTWPGMIPFNRVRPLILGMPFAMAWVALWITGSALVLWWIDRVEAHHRPRDGEER